MRVIAKKRLRDFWLSLRKDRAWAERDLLTWYDLARRAEWSHFADLKSTFGSADLVGNCVVFDVCNNRHRLIGRVNYRREIVYVLKVMDHREYDRTDWTKQCGCYLPPPKRKGVK